MENLRKIVDRVLERIVVVAMGALVLDVLWQVFTRFVLSDPSSFTEELARYLLIWVGLLGAAYAAGRNMHLALDLLQTKLSGQKARVMQIVIELIVLAFAVAVLLVGGSRLVYVMLRLGQTSPALGIALGYVYAVVPISGLVIAFYSLDKIMSLLKSGTVDESRPTAGEAEA
jgi:TRAP-type C4-dicarboxylate transport system permease small subunit